jgi:hypothetical protein
MIFPTETFVRSPFSVFGCLQIARDTHTHTCARARDRNTAVPRDTYGGDYNGEPTYVELNSHASCGCQWKIETASA